MSAPLATMASSTALTPHASRNENLSAPRATTACAAAPATKTKWQRQHVGPPWLRLHSFSPLAMTASLRPQLRHPCPRCHGSALRSAECAQLERQQLLLTVLNSHAAYDPNRPVLRPSWCYNSRKSASQKTTSGWAPFVYHNTTKTGGAGSTRVHGYEGSRRREKRLVCCGYFWTLRVWQVSHMHASALASRQVGDAARLPVAKRSRRRVALQSRHANELSTSLIIVSTNKSTNGAQTGLKNGQHTEEGEWSTKCFTKVSTKGEKRSTNTSIYNRDYKRVN